MYFESNRSSRDGLMAVGTVVMNRVASPLYPKTICGVVGEPHQFAPGVLTRALNKKELPLVEQAADAVLKGERYAPVGDATHFHVAGLRIPYRVHYVALAGGNAFYKRRADTLAMSALGARGRRRKLWRHHAQGK
jgi:spore germination cell wall hydrolase CwlJ-like protein